MRPDQILLHAPRNGHSVYQFTCPACLDPVEKLADPKATALLVCAGVDVATEDSLRGNGLATEAQGGGGVFDQRDDSPTNPAFTLDDVVTFHFLLMDDTYIEEFFEGQPC
jgi:hypothetical protein